MSLFPLISIIVPCFNSQHYLSQTIESCTTQTYSNIEIIIVDDGSSDDSLHIAKSWEAKYPNITVVSIENHGQCFARNQGLSIAKGEYIKFLDSDDLLFPFSIEQELNLINRFNADMSVVGEIGFNESNLEQIKLVFSQIDINLNDLICFNNPLDLIKKIGFSYNCVLVRKDKVDGVQGFDTFLKVAEESNLNLRLAISFPNLKIVYHPKKLLLKRIHHSSLSSQSRFIDTFYPLISIHRSAQAFLIKQSDNNVLKKYIFDGLYVACAYAYRNSSKNIPLVQAALKTWELANINTPTLKPSYHDLLHRLLGFWGAEVLLCRIRSLLRR